MSASLQNHGDQKTRLIRRVRVRRDRRPSVICAVATDSLPSSRRFGNDDGAYRFGNRTGQGREAWPFINFTAEHEADMGCRNRESSRIAPGCIPEQNGDGEKRRGTILVVQDLGALHSESSTSCRPGYPVLSQLRGARLLWKSSARREKRNTPFAEGGGAKIGSLQFRSRHGAEGINTKMERSKQ